APGCEPLARAKMRIPMDEPADVTGLVASDLTIEEAGLGALSPFRATRGFAAALGKAGGLEEAAQRSVGGQRIELGGVLGQRYEIVVGQPYAPALVGGVLGDDGMTEGGGDGGLLGGIGAQLAPEHRDGIALLLQGPIIPVRSCSS